MFHRKGSSIWQHDIHRRKNSSSCCRNMDSKWRYNTWNKVIGYSTKWCKKWIIIGYSRCSLACCCAASCFDCWSWYRTFRLNVLPCRRAVGPPEDVPRAAAPAGQVLLPLPRRRLLLPVHPGASSSNRFAFRVAPRLARRGVTATVKPARLKEMDLAMNCQLCIASRGTCL
jgi:hypothetical protein